LLPQTLREKWSLPGFSQDEINGVDREDENCSVATGMTSEGGSTSSAGTAKSRLKIKHYADNETDSASGVSIDGVNLGGAMFGGKLVGPVYPVIKSRPEDDLRDSGEKHGGSFLPRCVELFIERRPKYNSEAKNMCMKECQKIGVVSKDTILFC
jgi:hypothetical protein